MLTNVGQSYNSLESLQNFNRKRLLDLKSISDSDRDKALELAKTVKKSGKSACITGVMVAHCASNHRFYRPVHCEKESCAYCGQDKSPAHNRRAGVLLDTVKNWDAVSYLVITIPSAARDYFLSKKTLNEFRRYVKRKLKRDGFAAGVMRWHWAGDCTACNNKKGARELCRVCQGTGCGDTYKPHLNILLPAGNTVRTTKAGKIRQRVNAYEPGKEVLKKEYLNQWKKHLREWFKENLGIDTLGNIYHNFIGRNTKDRAKRIAHRVRYITRATLRVPALADEVNPWLKGYRNTSKFGAWVKPTDAEPTACPCCGKPLKWFAGSLENWNAVKKIEIKTGLFFIDDPPIVN